MKPVVFSMVAAALVTMTGNSRAETKPTYLCYFEATLVPCVRLHHSADRAWGSNITFKPTKAIPLWPNFVIIGGISKNKLWSDSNGNRAIPYDETKSNIETLPLTQPKFDETFINEEMASISTWWDSRDRSLMGLYDTRSVYHGDEVFELWKLATRNGIICATKPSLFALPNEQPESERYCVFARATEDSVGTKIDYCDFKVDLASEVREEIVCTVVATEMRGVRQVLSARYADWYFRGGAAIGEYVCTLPRISDDDLAHLIEGFVRPYVGESSKYSEKTDDGEKYYKAEGINIFDQKENMFLRAYIFGSRDSIVDKKRGPLSRFTMNLGLTVSAQASDNIIDYREPNGAASDRMRNNFEDALRTYLLKFSKKVACKSEFTN